MNRHQSTLAWIAVLALALVAGPAAAQIPVLEVKNGNVEVTGKLGIGAAPPAQSLHIKQATGQPIFTFEATQFGSLYNFKINGLGEFTIAKQGDGSPPALKVLSNTKPNTVIIGGAIQATGFNTSSSRTFKENFASLDGSEVLAKVAELPISRWSLIDDPRSTAHIGPMAEDFYASFGVGIDDRHINVSDMTGVALAAIQGLNAEVREKDRLIEDLLRRVEQLEQRLGER